ncbi:MAG: RAMP superfamily CRISPR-associated protein [Lachnospiraceae bacterium]|nr:RAMP superfamily CRISPR-associated protein [Lachnospiraceae bacterium]
MELKLKMTLLTDTIFGNGVSVPGGEDSSVLCDQEGFPYYKAGSLKGIFREELENYLAWNPDCGISTADVLGTAGSDEDSEEKLRFSDFVISDRVKRRVRESVKNPEDVLDAFTYLRTFTRLDEEGIVSKGSLRNYRCVKAGVVLTGRIVCEEKDAAWVGEILGLVKWVGTMRNRGFGKVRIEIV